MSTANTSTTGLSRELVVGDCFKVTSDYRPDPESIKLGAIAVDKGDEGVVKELKEGRPMVRVQMRQSSRTGFIPKNILAVNWLENYPCRALNDYEENKEKIMEKGDLGRVLDMWNKQVRVQIMTGINRGRLGWIPRARLEFGVRKIGYRIATIDRNVQPPPNVEVFLVDSTQLGRAVSAIIRVWHTHEKHFKLSFLPSWALELAADANKVTAMTAHILRACKEAGTLDVLQRNDFTLDDLMRAGRVLPDIKSVTRPSAYLFRYGFADESSGRQWTELYAGTSVVPGKRYVQHVSAKNGTNSRYDTSVHYSRARKSFRHEMFPWAIFSEANFTHMVRAVAEQIEVLLLDTYAPSVLNLTVNRDNRPGATESDLGRYASDRLQGIRLVEAADFAKQQAKWPGGCKRASFGATAGLNWNSPVMETQRSEKGIWIEKSVEFPGIGTVSNFRGKPHKATVDGACMEVYRLHRSDDLRTGATNFHVRLDAEGPIPKKGQECYPIFELTHGPAHPVPWARLPGLGTFTDWQFGNRLGFKIQWEDEEHVGQWHERYIQCEGIAHFRDPDGGGSLHSYTTAMAMIRRFRQSPRTELRTWEMDLSVARVTTMSFDNFDQRMLLKEKPAPGPESVPLRKSHDEILAELRAVVVRNPYCRITPPVEFDWLDRKSGQMGSRFGCDVCRLHRRNLKNSFLASNAYQCKAVYDGRQSCCELCLKMGRPCTQTPDPELFADEELCAALWILPKVKGAFASKEDVMVSQGSILEEEMGSLSTADPEI